MDTGIPARQGTLGRGAAAGATGGLVAAWVMNRFQAWWARRTEGSDRSHGAQSLQRGAPGHGIARRLAHRGSERGDDDAAVRVAKAVGEPLLGRRLDERAKDVGGTVAHYVMGVASGAIYGATAELAPTVTAGAGMPFGAAVWLVADEGVVPALGLSKPAGAYPPSTHAYAIASHLVYGVATELVRRTLRRAR